MTLLLVESMDEFVFPQTCVVTLGNFDGVHLGHQAVLKRVVDIAKAQRTKSVAITFQNHPSEVLRPNQPTLLLCSPTHRYHLLEQAGMDVVVAIPFTLPLAKQRPEDFLEYMSGHIPFSHLILGHDAVLGHNRQGDRKRIRAIASELDFELENLEPHTIHGIEVSSSKIREALSKGDLKLVSEFLGRPYSLWGQVTPGLGLGRKLGFPTLNFNVDGLCLPPLGVYGVDVVHDDVHLVGIANLGKAPTIRNENRPILEVHLLDNNIGLPPDTEVEIVFKSYIRPEKKFESIDSLKRQIESDIKTLRSHLT